MLDTLLSAVDRTASRSSAVSSLADGLLERLVPTTKARAAFYWVRKCRSVLILACPPSGAGDHEWCDVLCETHQGGSTCYWSTAKNCSSGCGPC